MQLRLVKFFSSLACFLVGCFLNQACSSATQIRHMNVHEIFEDEQVARLAIAAAKGNSRQIDRMLEEGVDINAPGERGRTPLWWAANAENYRGYAYLLDRGADPNAVVDRDHSIMDIVAGLRDTRFLERALEEGGDPNLVGWASRTPLWHVIGRYRRESLRNAKTLIDAGADLNYQDSVTKQTLLNSAGSARDWDMILLFLEHGADPFMRCTLGYDLLGELARGPRGVRYTAERLKVEAKVREIARERGIKIDAPDPPAEPNWPE